MLRKLSTLQRARVPREISFIRQRWGLNRSSLRFEDPRIMLLKRATLLLESHCKTISTGTEGTGQKPSHMTVLHDSLLFRTLCTLVYV